MRSSFRAEFFWIDCSTVAGHDKIVDAVLEIPSHVEAEQPTVIGFVLAEQQCWLAVAQQLHPRQLGVFDCDASVFLRAQAWPLTDTVPRPDIAKPNVRQYIDGGWGVGTIVMLFYNGVILGAVTVDYIRAGQTKFLAGWLLPHGAVEIPSILIAGQAGLVLALALIGWG